MPITSVGGTNIVRSNQTGVAIVGSGFLPTQGAGSVQLRCRTRSVSLSVSGWADTLITVAMALGHIPFGDEPYVRVTNNSGTVMDKAITFLPPTGEAYVWLASVNPTEAYRLVALPDLPVGGMIWYQGYGGGAIPTGLVVQNDGTHGWTSGTEQPWQARLWDPTDESYQPSFALQYYTLDPPAPNPGAPGGGVVVAAGRSLRAAGPRLNWRR